MNKVIHNGGCREFVEKFFRRNGHILLKIKVSFHLQSCMKWKKQVVRQNSIFLIKNQVSMVDWHFKTLFSDLLFWKQAECRLGAYMIMKKTIFALSKLNFTVMIAKWARLLRESSRIARRKQVNFAIINNSR